MHHNVYPSGYQTIAAFTFGAVVAAGVACKVSTAVVLLAALLFLTAGHPLMNGLLLLPTLLVCVASFINLRGKSGRHRCQ